MSLPGVVIARKAADVSKDSAVPRQGLTKSGCLEVCNRPPRLAADDCPLAASRTVGRWSKKWSFQFRGRLQQLNDKPTASAPPTLPDQNGKNHKGEPFAFVD